MTNLRNDDLLLISRDITSYNIEYEQLKNDLIAAITDDSIGQVGPIGPSGPIGATGPIGPVGPVGDPGPTGGDGAPGTPGTPGKDGKDGSNGTNGTNGDSFFTRSGNRINPSNSSDYIQITRAPGIDCGGYSSGGVNGLSGINLYAGSNQNSSSNVGGIILGSGSTGNTPYVAATKKSGGQALDLRFMANGITRQTIKADGKVGIGKDSPGAKLDVDGTIRGNNVNFYMDPTAYSTKINPEGDEVSVYTGELLDVKETLLGLLRGLQELKADVAQLKTNYGNTIS